jgi:hypothetical protein
VIKYKAIEFLLKLSDLLSVCHHAGITAIRLPHDLVDDELRIVMDVKPLDPELGGDVQAVDEGLILHHIVSCVEMQSGHVEELIPLIGEISTMPPPTPVESERVIEVHAPGSPGQAAVVSRSTPPRSPPEPGT